MSWAEMLAAAEAIRADAAAREPSLADLPVVGVGWATVEADRAIAELGSIIGVGARWVPQERDPVLGASAWRREPSADPGVWLFVLEPDTEGRLAAFLARYGEGVAAVYLAGGSADDRVVPVNLRWGPYAIVRATSR